MEDNLLMDKRERKKEERKGERRRRDVRWSDVGDMEGSTRVWSGSEERERRDMLRGWM